MTGYPVRLPVDGRRVVVVGGGLAAGRETAALQAAGAVVLAVPAGRYRAADLDGAWLVLACAEEPGVNAQVAADAARNRVWCAEPGGPGGRVLVLGGARSGKSVTAERFLAGSGRVEYVATGMPPGDDDAEWAARVAAHRGRRPARWHTTETLDLAGVLAAADPAPVLIDCLSLWLARVMDECGAWDAAAGDACAGDAVDSRVDALLAAWRATARPVVAVSNEVGCGVVPATASGRLYRDVLGRLNALVAADSDQVWLCTAGLPRRLR